MRRLARTRTTAKNAEVLSTHLIATIKGNKLLCALAHLRQSQLKMKDDA